MLIKTPLTDKQVFNDGVCRIYGVRNGAAAGSRPKPELVQRYERVPFEKRTAGVMRLYYASLEGVDISFVLRIPAQFRISSLDVCTVGKDMYEVQRVQLITDKEPMAQDLTLRKVDNIYDIAGISKHAAKGD